jgi:uncharacterized damage-inducible protein DinB
LIDIKALYGYSAKVRRKFLEKLDELPWEGVTTNREASWYSMSNIMVHMIDNEDWIVNWVINNKATEYRRAHKFEEYKSIAEIRNHLDEVEERTRVYMAKAGTQELQRMVKFTLSSGTTFDMTVEESLFQSFTEQLYHLGEIIALLWQDDIEPPRMQWFYNRDSLSLSMV